MNNAYKQLRRSSSDKVLGGVCSGLAHYFGVDPVLVRVAFVVAGLLTGGALVIAYLIMWIIIPDDKPAQPWSSGPQDGPYPPSP